MDREFPSTNEESEPVEETREIIPEAPDRTKQIEQTLRQHEKTLQSIFSAVPVGIGIVVNRTFTECNDRFCEIVGYQREEILGQRARILYLSDEEFERIGTEGPRNIAEAGFLQTETKWRKKDGTIIDGLLSLAPIDVDDPGKGQVFVVLDVTAHRRAEEALRRERVFADAVLDSVPGLLYLYDDQGRLIRWNKKHEEMTGYSSEELARMRLLDWYKDSPEDIARITAGVKRALQDGYAEEEGNLQTKDGRRIPFHFTAVRLNIDNNLYFAGIGIDITNRKRADEQLKRNLFETQVRLAVSQALASTESEDEVLNVLVQQANLYPSACVSLTTIGMDGDRPAAILRRVDPCKSGISVSVPTDTRLPGEFSPILGPLVNGHSFISEDVFADARLNSFTTDLCRRLGVISVAAFPIMVGKECLGILGLGAKSRSFFDEEKQALYGTIAEQGAVALRAARLREKTRDSQQRLSLFVQQSPLAAIEWDRNLDVVSWNPAAGRIFGYSSEEAIGRNAKDLILHPSALPHIDKVRRKLLAQAGGTRNVNENVTKDGRVITCEWFNAPLVGPDGQVRGIASLVEDITDRKQAEGALRESEEKYRALFESANDCIHLIEGDRWVECNSRGLVMYGCASRAEMIGTTPADFSPPTQPDGRNSLEKAREVINAAREGHPQRFDWKHQRKDGTLMDVEVSLSRLVLGEKVYVLAIERDITEQKGAEEALRQSQEKYRAFFEQNLAGNYISTPQGVILACNPSFVRMFGFESEAEAKQTNFFSLYESPDARRKFLSQLKQQGHLEYYDEELRRKDGTPLYVTKNAIGAFDKDGELSEIHGFLIDESERRKTEQQLRQAQKMEAVGNLAGGIAHDFNNILGVIIGHSEMMVDQADTQENIARHAKAIHNAANRAATLTSQLLAFSRKQLLQPKVLNLNRVIEGIHAMIGRLIGDEIEVKTILASDLENVRADRGQMEQVIINFCVNARDAMPKGGNLIIETANADVDAFLAEQHFPMKPGRYVRFAVTDTGIGMDKEILAHIFEPFFTTKELGKGTGLGLATVYGIVKQSDGHVWAYSEPGQGSTLSVYLPAVVEQAVTHAPDATQSFVARGTETILVVEDLAPLRALVQELLETLGYNVLEAEDAEEAFEIAALNKDIALLLTDLSLPRVSGSTIANALVEKMPKLKVLYMSAHANMVGFEGTQQPGTDFLQKPFTKEDLARKLRQLLDNP